MSCSTWNSRRIEALLVERVALGNDAGRPAAPTIPLRHCHGSAEIRSGVGPDSVAGHDPDDYVNDPVPSSARDSRSHQPGRTEAARAIKTEDFEDLSASPAGWAAAWARTVAAAGYR